MTPTLAATLRAVYVIHDALEDLLTDAERFPLGELATTAKDALWAAHDHVERATLKLHALASPEELAAVQAEAA